MSTIYINTESLHKLRGFFTSNLSFADKVRQKDRKDGVRYVKNDFRPNSEAWIKKNEEIQSIMNLPDHNIVDTMDDIKINHNHKFDIYTYTYQTWIQSDFDDEGYETTITHRFLKSTGMFGSAFTTFEEFMSENMHIFSEMFDNQRNEEVKRITNWLKEEFSDIDFTILSRTINTHLSKFDSGISHSDTHITMYISKYGKGEVRVTYPIDLLREATAFKASKGVRYDKNDRPIEYSDYQDYYDWYVNSIKDKEVL